MKKKPLSFQSSYPVYLLSKDIFLKSIVKITVCMSSVRASKNCKCIHTELL